MLTIKNITQYLESLAPSTYQESYDNSGLIVGNPQAEVKGILLSLDATEQIVEEALDKSCNLIIAHHPIVFKGLKRLNGKNYVERTLIKAIKNDIAIYAIHTNLDNVKGGVNFKIAEKLNLQHTKVLLPKANTLMKLTSFVPLASTKRVLESLGKAGAGQIGEYKNCSFRTVGTGTFQPTAQAQPHIGEANKAEEVEENRVEVVFPKYLQHKVLSALRAAHPYEEVAYYLHTLENYNQDVGAGAIGELSEALTGANFLAYLKEKMNLNCIRYTSFLNKKIKTVALCGGTGSFLLRTAISQKADVFISADFKYHEFFEADSKILIADIGHYESEVFTKDLLFDYLKLNFSNIKLQLSEINTNPIRYFF